MREFCNLAYTTLAQGRNTAQMAELDSALVPEEEKRAIFDKINAASMQQLGLAPIIPIRPPSV